MVDEAPLTKAERIGFGRYRIVKEPAKVTPGNGRGTYAPVSSALVPVAVRQAVGQVAVPKENAVRSEAYRRLVASFPCINCGLWGYSQFAHVNAGKGLALKVDDRFGFALCTVHPDSAGDAVEGCHEKFDQGKLFTRVVRREVEAAWAADTQRRVIAMGKWPADVPALEE